MIKYRYALDIHNSIIDVSTLERSELTITDKFFSIDFKQELIPRLGQIKVKHFAHKHTVNALGNRETYLHALGKKIFVNEYSKCLTNNTNFYFEYKVQQYCNRLQKEYNIVCKLKSETRKFDLAKYYTEIYIEKQDDNFRPDILLFNPKTKEKIYVEIAVTHSSSELKKYSGNRIIEFKFSTEDDVHQIIEFKNEGTCKISKYHNFKIKEETTSFCKTGNCVHSFNYFSVSVDGRCNLLLLKEDNISFTIDKYKTNTIWYKIDRSILIKKEEDSDDDFYYDNSMRNIFLKYIAIAYQEKVKIKNCYICKYHAQNKKRHLGDNKPIFCKFQKIICGSNDASICAYYRVSQVYVNEYLGK